MAIHHPPHSQFISQLSFTCSNNKTICHPLDLTGHRLLNNSTKLTHCEKGRRVSTDCDGALTGKSPLTVRKPCRRCYLSLSVGENEWWNPRYEGRERSGGVGGGRGTSATVTHRALQVTTAKGEVARIPARVLVLFGALQLSKSSKSAKKRGC